MKWVWDETTKLGQYRRYFTGLVYVYWINIEINSQPQHAASCTPVRAPVSTPVIIPAYHNMALDNRAQSDFSLFIKHCYYTILAHHSYTWFLQVQRQTRRKCTRIRNTQRSSRRIFCSSIRWNYGIMEVLQYQLCDWSDCMEKENKTNSDRWLMWLYWSNISRRSADFNRLSWCFFGKWWRARCRWVAVSISRWTFVVVRLLRLFELDAHWRPVSCCWLTDVRRGLHCRLRDIKNFVIQYLF